MLSTLPKTNFSFSSKFNLWSANSFNLDQSENLSFGRVLNHLLFVVANNLNIDKFKISTSCKEF